ncbi:MAG: IMP dehydrogenase [Chloroflexi bacterium]|nr:IMP dehydrogenase [Chloroflexota bacterium]
MAYYCNEPSRTFREYMLIPNLTARDCIAENVELRTPVVRFRKGEASSLNLNIPLSSAVMQSVSNDRLAIALARSGGISFIYQSQPIEEQAEMVRRVKKHKAGFVVSDSNLTPKHTLADVLALKEKTGHSSIAITADGSPSGRLLGIVTSRDYRPSRTPVDAKVEEFMTPFSQMVCGGETTTLEEANDLLWGHKLNCLPIVDEAQRLLYLVFRKDYDAHKDNPQELVDAKKRLVVGAGINTRDYRERVPALVEAGVDMLCVDSSDGFTEWQGDTIRFVKEEYGDSVKVGGGNVVDREGFLFLAESGADFVKIGIGGGSICITSEEKGIGRGQATAVIEVDRARDEYYDKMGVYIPLCSDGGLVYDYHIALALAMGADFVMMGRYFARFDESPSQRLKLGSSYVKEYWGEGSNRARNWQRYDLGGKGGVLPFEEGVDAYVPYAGGLAENVRTTLSKIKAVMCNCGARSLQEYHGKARLTLVSELSFREAGAHDVILRGGENT